MIMAILTARQFISLDTLPKRQKCNQEYFVQSILPSFLNEKKRFSRQRTAIKCSGPRGNSMCRNGHRVADELRRLKILRVPHPSSSPDISPCDFWMFGDFKGKLKDRHLQGLAEDFMAFHELWDTITFEELQMGFESWRDRLRWIIEHHRGYFRK
jgi:hypothetical protein